MSKPTEADKINYIMELVAEQRKRNNEWGNYTICLVGAIGLSYMTFQSVSGAALGGWFAWIVLGARLAIIDAIYRAEQKRAMVEFDGDFEELEANLSVFKGRPGLRRKQKES